MKKVQTTLSAFLRRITVIFGVILGIALSPIQAIAHEGAHLTRIISDVQRVDVAGNRMTLSIAVANYSENDVILLSAFAQDAEASAIAPVVISSGDKQDIEVTLFFENTIPAIFTVLLDFGEDGQGPVLVIN